MPSFLHLCISEERKEEKSFEKPSLMTIELSLVVKKSNSYSYKLQVIVIVTCNYSYFTVTDPTLEDVIILILGYPTLVRKIFETYFC